MLRIENYGFLRSQTFTTRKGLERWKIVSIMELNDRYEFHLAHLTTKNGKHNIVSVERIPIYDIVSNKRGYKIFSSVAEYKIVTADWLSNPTNLIDYFTIVC